MSIQSKAWRSRHRSVSSGLSRQRVYCLDCTVSVLTTFQKLSKLAPGLGVYSTVWPLQGFSCWFSESLAGRKKIFEIFPLTFNELLRFKGVVFPSEGRFSARPFILAEYERLKHYYDEYIQFGGFPEVVLADTVSDKRDLISDILSSYINFDIISITDIKRSADVFRLVRLLASRIGSKLEITKLTKLLGLNRSTVENYLHLLEQSYLIRSIPVLANSPDREIVKARKVYFLDNGIAAAVADLSSGAKFENAVFNQLLHFGEIAYYQMKTGREIDFILNKATAFEAKETATASDLKSLQNLAKNLEITDCHVVVKKPLAAFDGMVWGGFLM